jgi:transposase/phage anti-repressor protein
MRCVCPMGGNRTCPDDCPTGMYWSLSKPDRKAQRKSIVEKLYTAGLTMEQIATQLGVSTETISQDLRNFQETGKSKPAKTATNPKGAGRPKGSNATSKARRKNTTAEADAAARDIVDGNKSYPEAEKETGLSNTVLRSAVAREEGRREPKVDPDTLSMTVKQKLAAAIKQARRELEHEIRQQLQAEYQKWLVDILVDYREKEKHYDIVIAQRKGFMKRAQFARFRFALHPDTYKNVDVAERNELVAAWERLKIIMLDEKEAPATGQSLPATREEMLKRKAEYQAQRAAQRTSKRPDTNSVAR